MLVWDCLALGGLTVDLSVLSSTSNVTGGLSRSKIEASFQQNFLASGPKLSLELRMLECHDAGRLTSNVVGLMKSVLELGTTCLPPRKGSFSATSHCWLSSCDCS